MSFNPFGTSPEKEDNSNMPVFGNFSSSFGENSKNEESAFSSFAESAFSKRIRY